MPAFDDAARLATDVDVTADANGSDVSTATGSAMASVPGGRAQQALIWFDGAITATALAVNIEEKIGSAYRTLAVARFGTTLDPVATYASNGAVYTHCVFQVSYNAAALRYRISEYAGGGSALDLNIAIMPFEGASAPVGFPA